MQHIKRKALWLQGRAILALAVLAGGLFAGVFLVDTLRPSTVATNASPDDVSLLVKELASQGEVSDAQYVDCRLSETLPNFLVSWNGTAGQRLFGATVDGRVLSVQPGISNRDSIGAEDRVSRETLTFEDKAANWRTILLKVEVLNDFDALVATPDQIEIVMWLDGATNPELVIKGFQGQRIFAVLERPGRLEPETAYPVARNGALMGLVSEDGSITFPGLDESQDSYLGTLTSVSAINAAAKEPPLELKLSTANGYWERSDCK